MAEIGAVEDLVAERGVRLDRLVLVQVEPGRLLQDGIGNADLADVVHEPGEPDRGDVLVVELQVGGEQDTELGDRLGVAAGVGVLGVDGARQRGREGAAVTALVLGIGRVRVRHAGHEQHGFPIGGLGLQQRDVGLPDENVAGGELVRLGDSDAHLDRSGVELAVQALGELEGLPRRCLGQQRGELVAPGPVDRVARPHGPRENAADVPDRAITRLVPFGVIDQLERVEVEHHEAEVPAVAAPVRQRPHQVLLEGPVVADPGQAVGQRRPLEALELLGKRVVDLAAQRAQHEPQGDHHGQPEQCGDDRDAKAVRLRSPQRVDLAQ